MDEHRELWWESPTKEFGRVVRLELPEPFRTVHGGRLHDLQVSYEAWGDPAAAKNATVLIIHPLTTDCHATGEYLGQPRGWWEPLIGPGRAIDTDRGYVVCPNLVGGCFGTTGPRFPAPDGEPYLDRFPLLTPRDMMRVQRLFLTALGIERASLVVGPSMGGMIAWEWALARNAGAERVVVVAAPLRTTPYQIGLNWLQRRGIELDITENEVVSRWGQTVARGVGMLSYRSPEGLEGKFAREWFIKPGSTLRERGRFLVESWLRHHGQRITKRFDAYTYLLFSRAMDLHDVSEGRGNLVAALQRISCPVLAIGISSDTLYPAGDVRFAADFGEHLGRDVRYAEIRSPHGHDAFLLDTDQIASLLGDFLRDEIPVAGAAPATRELRTVGVGILGAGRVAASFLQLIRERGARRLAREGLRLEVCGVAEIDPHRQLGEEFAGLGVTRDAATLVEREDVDVLLDLTRGEGSRSLVERALRRRLHVVTPNKVLLRNCGDELSRIALANGVRLAYHDSIAAGWPLIHALDRPLGRGHITEIRAVLSSSCNLILERMESGVPLVEAVLEATARGLTEPEPELDVSGWDSAQKLIILLARAVGRRYPVHDVDCRGLADLDPELVRRAAERDLVVKLVALAAGSEERIAACVRPIAVARESHLGLAKHESHVVVLRDREGGEMVYFGTGSGPLPVATAVLNDLIGVFTPQRSWTGRFPAAAAPLASPDFDRYLALADGNLDFAPGPRPRSVPVLGERSPQPAR